MALGGKIACTSVTPLSHLIKSSWHTDEPADLRGPVLDHAGGPRVPSHQSERTNDVSFTLRRKEIKNNEIHKTNTSKKLASQQSALARTIHLEEVSWLAVLHIVAQSLRREFGGVT